MNKAGSFSEDELDALREVLNIAMGQAGDSLARVLDVFVRLSVPRIRVVRAVELGQTVTDLLHSHMHVTAVRQAFTDSIRGEAVMVYGETGCRELADLMGYGPALDAVAEQELLLDVSNILIGACLCGLAQQLHLDISFSAPSVMAQRVDATSLFRPDQVSWSHALLLEVSFSLEERSFVCHLFSLMPEADMLLLREAIVQFLAFI